MSATELCTAEESTTALLASLLESLGAHGVDALVNSIVELLESTHVAANGFVFRYKHTNPFAELQILAKAHSPKMATDC
jgi:hypothetical protein